LNLALNNPTGEWNDASLALLLEELQKQGADVETTGWSKEEVERLLAPDDKKGGPSLAERFLVPPFSILDARQGYWRKRKMSWLSLGLKGEIGRGKNLLKRSLQERVAMQGGGYEEARQRVKQAKEDGKLEELEGGSKGTSIFDPVLCEIAYRWFCPREGRILDPFAGGSVRGLVAASLGHPYVGIDLRAEQVQANEAQWLEMQEKLPQLVQAEGKPTSKAPAPKWITGDSVETLAPRNKAKIGQEDFDLLFTCPPYADLEVYSDDPKDLSTMKYPDFNRAYASIIIQASKRLKQDRFAVIVVGEVRDQAGFNRNFVSDTIAAFEACGLRYYNEAILITSAGTLPLRAARIFNAGRKLGKTHQNVLVFVKGDPSRAAAACGNVDGLQDALAVMTEQPELEDADPEEAS
jgi:DNA modification methylase